MGQGKRHGQAGRQEGARRGQGPGARRGPSGKEQGGNAGHRGQGGQGSGAGGYGKSKWHRPQGEGGMEGVQGEVAAVQRIPPGIQQMPVHHTHHHHSLRMYNIDTNLGALISPQPTQLPRPARPCPRSAGGVAILIEACAWTLTSTTHRSLSLHDCFGLCNPPYPWGTRGPLWMMH